MTEKTGIVDAVVGVFIFFGLVLLAGWVWSVAWETLAHALNLPVLTWNESIAFIGLFVVAGWAFRLFGGDE